MAAAAAACDGAVAGGCLETGDVDEATVGRCLATGDAPPVDLLVRTSGESRLSNFMLWQCARAELVRRTPYTYAAVLYAAIDVSLYSARLTPTKPFLTQHRCSSERCGLHWGLWI